MYTTTFLILGNYANFLTRTKEDFFMKKNEKRTYLSPETEVVRFNAEDIITTSGPDHKQDIEIDVNDPNYSVANP